MRRPRLLSPIVALAFAVPAVADPPASEVRFFETRIRPLLAEHCYECHGTKKQKSELRLDSAEAVRKGGVSGEPAVVPGEPDKSLIIRAVRHAGGVAAMPPKKTLGERDVADLARWVKAGAVYPAPTNVARADDKHWAFVPPADPPIPTVKDVDWAKTPIDRFILATLEARGLRPASPADRRTLIRRVTFDLTGLPPSPEDVESFVADKSPEAFAKVVDRLLASPAYGERWARHWLDVARYADSNGLDENVAYGNAWRYRDYIVASFNADKPYDRFLTEQIAGDLLPSSDVATRHERLIATGFLALGPKVLAEVDEKKMELDIVDEQLDTLGQAVMGVTLGCARCHDHKFDPISQEDYYALAGVFVSTKTMENFTKIARWHENPIASPAELAKKAEHDKAVAKVNESIKTLTGKADEQVRAAAKPGEKLPAKLELLYPEATKAELKKLRDELATVQKAAPDVPSAMGVTEGKATDVALLRRGNHLTPGKVVPRRFPTVLARETQAGLPMAESGRRELADWLTRPDHPLTARVIVNRLWRWHFGQGLVRSVDNFGKLGDKPTHPELLDWLVRRFIESGWSIKSVHRLILLSATYQMGGDLDAKGAEVDPDNRLWWRIPPRRLEAEAIRDSLLAVAGRLDRTPGGPAITHVKNREFLFDHTSKDGTKYESRRRSLYLPVIRNNLYDVFQLFDATDATVTKGDRATTTVATQALFHMNSDLVADSAARLAERLLAVTELGDPDRVDRLYRTTYGRPATAPETERFLHAVTAFDGDLQIREPDTAKRRAKAWALACQVVLAANEFVYVR
jgi:mono/diheme cytochrome c family protein/cytochrome c553